MVQLVNRLLLEQKALTCRTFLAYGVDAQAPLDRIEAAIREAASSPLHQRDEMLWLRGIKAFLDGGMAAHERTGDLIDAESAEDVEYERDLCGF